MRLQIANTHNLITIIYFFLVLITFKIIFAAKYKISTPLIMENPVRSPMVPPIADNMSTNFAALSFVILSNVGVSKLIRTNLKVFFHINKSKKHLWSTCVVCIKNSLYQFYDYKYWPRNCLTLWWKYRKYTCIRNECNSLVFIVRCNNHGKNILQLFLCLWLGKASNNETRTRW